MNEENQGNNYWFIGLLISLLIWSLFFRNPTYEDQTAEEWYNEYDQCTADLDNYKTALEEANTNIDEANSQIEDIQGCEYGCSYEDMDYKIRNLETVNTVDEP